MKKIVKDVILAGLNTELELIVYDRENEIDVTLPSGEVHKISFSNISETGAQKRDSYIYDDINFEVVDKDTLIQYIKGVLSCNFDMVFDDLSVIVNGEKIAICVA